MQAKLLPLYTQSTPPWDGVKRFTLFFIIRSCYIYQIHGNDNYDKMQTNIKTFHTPSTHGVRDKGQNIFSESGHVAYQIKGEVGTPWSSTPCVSRVLCFV